jgi:flagellar motor switch protein FliN
MLGVVVGKNPGTNISMKEVSHDWLALVEKALVKTQQLPPLEENFPFPWTDASRAISSALKLSDLNISSTHASWKEQNELLQGLGGKPIVLSIEISPIQGSIFFALSDQDVAYLTTESLVSGEHKEGFSNAKLREGFYSFLFLKVLEAVDHLKVFKQVSFHLAPAMSLHERAFCIEIDCALPGKTLRGRLICPEPFLTAFKDNQPMQKGTLLSSDATENIEVTLRCEVGYTTLPQGEWDELRVGDFLLLDRCTYDPSEEKGSVTLMLGNTPLLMARMKSEGMKILDFAYYKEEEGSTEPTESNELTLTAEVGRITLPLHKLLHLEPGMMIDLVMRPEQGIDIILDTKKVADGELLQLGDTVGLRILNIPR